ncbi:tyrosine-protein phosphatase [Kordiimonas sp. SCSIO 12610]|uniref:tyrosine-protein phosphatase n=1 Tax=Kordiimonas sp. SCSIO 12610 TaxID=2829597 RepID=UPI00210BD232|nr:tyrosine-protein phosphatase [Kordiimonas sp. SCSIO 12610]UTW55038.1 tyrosine-protein phosphatase [Kordiimonas sp. SCSIO 12610]
MQHDRLIAINGIKNLRDMGGYKSLNGGHIKWKKLYRSGRPSELDSEQHKDMAALNIDTVVDFRSAREKENSPITWNNHWQPDYREVPIGGNAAAWVKELFEKLSTSPFPAKELNDQFILAFQTIPIENVDGLRKLFDVLVDHSSDNTAALFHCTAGKDRTGIAGALIMRALNIHSDDIMADFLMTNDAVDLKASSKELAEWASEKAGRAIDADAVLPLVGVKEDFLHAAYKTIDEKFGSMDQYLEKGMGLTPKRLETFRHNLLS